MNHARHQDRGDDVDDDFAQSVGRLLTRTAKHIVGLVRDYQRGREALQVAG